MYPLWLLVAFSMGTHCIPLPGIYDTCPSIKTSKLVHADFLTGCAKKDRETVSNKLCTLYAEILKKLCEAVKDTKLPFSDTDIEKALLSTDITKVCGVLSTFELDDAAKTKEVLLPVADHHCFRTCVNDDFKALPICSYGAYILNYTNVHSALEKSSLTPDPKMVNGEMSINAADTVSVSKSGNDNTNVVENPSNSAANKYPLQLQPRVISKNPDESKPVPSPSSDNAISGASNEKNKQIETPNGKSNDPTKSEAIVGKGSQDQPLNSSSHADEPTIELNQVASIEEGPKKDIHDQVDPHKIENNKDDTADPKKLKVHVGKPEDLGSEKHADSQKPIVEPPNEEKKKQNQPETNEENKKQNQPETNEEKKKQNQPETNEEKKKQNQPETNVLASPEGDVGDLNVISNNGVSGVDDTLMQQNSQGGNKEVASPKGQNTEVASSKGQNIEVVNQQEQLQLDDNDLEDDDSDIEPPNDNLANNESPKTTIEAKPKPVEKKPIKTEYFDPDEVSHSYKTENTDDGDSYFFSYFMVICLVFIGGYVIYHNKQRILALIVEGRKGRRGSRSRRPNSANYKKLDSNLEEAISSSCNKSATHVIY